MSNFKQFLLKERQNVESHINNVEIKKASLKNRKLRNILVTGLFTSVVFLLVQILNIWLNFPTGLETVLSFISSLIAWLIDRPRYEREESKILEDRQLFDRAKYMLNETLYLYDAIFPLISDTQAINYLTKAMLENSNIHDLITAQREVNKRNKSRAINIQQTIENLKTMTNGNVEIASNHSLEAFKAFKKISELLIPMIDSVSAMCTEMIAVIEGNETLLTELEQTSISIHTNS